MAVAKLFSQRKDKFYLIACEWYLKESGKIWDRVDWRGDPTLYMSEWLLERRADASCGGRLAAHKEEARPLFAETWSQVKPGEDSAELSLSKGCGVSRKSRDSEISPMRGHSRDIQQSSVIFRLSGRASGTQFICLEFLGTGGGRNVCWDLRPLYRRSCFVKIYSLVKWSLLKIDCIIVIGVHNYNYSGSWLLRLYFL